MKARSYLQRRTNTQSSEYLSARIQPRPFSEPHFEEPQNTGHDFSQVDLFSHAPQRGTIQAKLTVGAPNDVYEQEADRVAEQVMSTPDSATQQPVQREAMPEEEELQMKPLAGKITPLIQREEEPEPEEEVQMKALGTPTIQRQDEPEPEEELQMKSLGTPTIQREESAEAEEEELQMKSLGTPTLQREESAEAEEEELQMKPSLQRQTDGSLQAGGNLEGQLNSSQGNGAPLPDDVRTFMEPRFGTDFSQVRVHTGSEAIQMNQDLNAQAFTHKQDIYFGSGKSPANDALTAHELTHVVQQNGAIPQSETHQE